MRTHLCRLSIGLASALAFADASGAASEANSDWPAYLGDKGRSLYSPLRHINRSNVAQLKVAWTYDTGDKGEYQANNLIIAGVLYTASPTRKVIALDAATGRELWKWDPQSERPGGAAARQRGLVFWQNETGGEQRLFTGVGNYLYALEPKSGQPIRSFGQNGSIHLGTGLDVEGTPGVGLNTPGVTYKDLLIIGGIGGPGAVRAFDVRTGLRRWIFHLIPRPGELGYDTWPAEAYKTATGLMPWCGQSLDEKRGIVYVPTKTAEPDFYGGNRHGANLFANSLVALDASTGKRLWHYQIVHHDLLDKDLPCPPVLLTVTHRGKKIDAVAQGTKHGLLFVFDRVTGEPLWPIEEKPVRQSELRGEQTWPTQPFPTRPAPLMRQRYTEADASTISPQAHTNTLDRIRASPNFGPFPAPSLRETIMFPGFDGGMEWGGGAADPEGNYYVNINEIPGSCKWSKHAGPTARPSRLASGTTWPFVRLVTAWIARAARLADFLPLSTSAAESHASNCHSSPNRAPGGCPPSIRSPTLSATPFWITCSAWTNLSRRVLKLEMLRWRPQTQLRRMRSPDSVAGSTRKVIPPSSRPGAR